MNDEATPPLSPGLTYVAGADAGAVQRLAFGAERSRRVLWVDAGGAASTYGLTALAPGERALDGIRVARAFTAHQHHQLVRDAVAEAGPRTALVVAPNVAALYEASDASAAAVDRLFAATVELLADLAAARSVPVLVSAPRASDERRATVRERIDREIECRDTDLGYAFAGEEFETTGYWHRGWWQTTVPYWADLAGVADVRPLDRLAAPLAPVERDPIETTLATATE